MKRADGLTLWSRESGGNPPFWRTAIPGAGALTESVVVLDGGRELASEEGVEAAEAGVEFGGGEAAFAIERAEEVGGGAFPFFGIAFEAAGNQVAVRVASETRAGHDVIDALHVGRSAAEAVKARAAFAIVNGFAERPSAQEIGGVERMQECE